MEQRNDGPMSTMKSRLGERNKAVSELWNEVLIGSKGITEVHQMVCHSGCRSEHCVSIPPKGGRPSVKCKLDLELAGIVGMSSLEYVHNCLILPPY